ncbi:MAG: OmpA-like transrane domain [Moraxellaceae bacterium]|jgi:hypothetical protein|nr:OmpA-like transrane domain [Moraxellaceae bacterium]
MIKKVVLASLLAMPALASAQGLYFTAGAGLGSTDMENIENSYGAGAPLRTDDDLQRAVVGVGAEVSEYLAVEGVYMSEAEATVGAGTFLDTLEHSGLQLAVLAKAPLAPQFALFGKLSANFISTEYDFNVAGTNVYSEDSSGAYLGFGVGAEVRVNDNVGIRATAERIMMDDIIDENFLTEPGDVDVNQFTLALNFYF